MAFCGKELQYATEVVLPAPEVVPQAVRAVEGSVATRGAFPPPATTEGARRRGKAAAEAEDVRAAPEVDDARSKRRRGGQR